MNKAQKKLITIISAIGAALLLLMVVITSVMFSMASYMDQFLGRGKEHVVGSKGLEADYIDFKAKTKEDGLKIAQEATEKTSDEGIVLLKNDNALPFTQKGKEKKLTVLGYYSWHNNMSGGEDPATTSGAISLAKGLETKFSVNSAVTQLYAGVRGDFDNPEAALASAQSTFAEYNTAVVTLKRNSGEGNDQTKVLAAAAEGGRTGLTINNAELKLLDYACKNFDTVIVVINAANTMELGFLEDRFLNNGNYTDPYTNTTYNFSKIKAALWAGCCGSQGGTSLANILNGDVNPSGHTPDIYASDLTKDPTYVNFGSYKYTNSASLNSYADSSYFVEYEEGIYIGYRYHETAAYEAARGNYEGYDYNKAVVYPFGYGLSYTTFSQEWAETPTYDAATQTYNFKVKVTNTGSVAGKGVAQVYVSLPWQQGQVEKAHVQLIGFAKTPILEPGASRDLEISAPRDYFTSYDYKNEKAYVLDAGAYKFYVANDRDGSHSWATVDAEDAATQAKHLWTHTLDSKVVFSDSKDGKRSTDLVTATNAMDDELNYKFKEYNEGSTGDGYAHNFTRANFKASFPTAPTGNDYVLSDERAKKQIAVYDVWSDEAQNAKDINGNTIGKQTVNTDETSYTLADMRGVPFDDEKWDDYINQFTLDSMVAMFSNGGWQEVADEENGVPLSYDLDSPYGFYGHGVTGVSGNNRWYCGAPMVAATFNVELAKEIGEAFGEEAYSLKATDGKPLTGLYGFGMNQHRSAFGGRNYEYYSEDPVLCGKIGMAEASGASEKGLICFMKHYVLNDQEENRQANGYCAWVNEQAFREVYTRAWEIYMKEAKMTVNYYAVNDNDEYEMTSTVMSAATGIMTCYNRIGATYGGASVSINKMLRNEFGFTGTVVTDAGGEPNTYMTTDFALRRGQNLTLANNGTNALYDTESNAAIYWLKRSTRHLLYNKANSNVMVGIAPGDRIYYDMSPWKIGIIVGWVVVGLLVVGAVVVDILIAKEVIKVSEKAPKEKAKDADEY